MFALKPIKYVDIEEFVMCLMILLHSRLRLHFSESCEKLVFVCHAEVTGFFFFFFFFFSTVTQTESQTEVKAVRFHY